MTATESRWQRYIVPQIRRWTGMRARVLFYMACISRDEVRAQLKRWNA